MNLHKRLNLFYLIVLSLFQFQMSWADGMTQAIDLFNQKKIVEAIQILEPELQKDPNNLVIYNNLGVFYLANGQKGKALAVWIKALRLDPGFESAQQGVQFVKSQLKPNSFSIKKTDYESFRESALSSLSLNLLLVLSLLCLLGTGVQWIRHFAQIKIANMEDASPPQVSVLTILFSGLLLVLVGLSVLKIQDDLTPRAIVISESTVLKISPGEEQTKIIELNEGTEVELGQSKDTWVQVRIPGNYSGWVNSKDLQIIL